MALAASTPLDDLVATLANRAAAADAGRLDDVGRLVHVERVPGRDAGYGELARPLPPAVTERLGVDRLWSHQVEAIDHLRDGRSVVVATGTGSGKSLVYQAAIAESSARPVRPGSALCLFPTKALARDQLRSMAEQDFGGVVAGAYDGDTDRELRTWVRRNANVVLTNPEMLHSGLLPHHPRWTRFLSRLDYVVIDELHVFRGVFGSHVAHLLRRLRRLCRHYGSDPTFCFTSATLGTPEVLASELAGLPVEAVTQDGSPCGERLIALWNPPLVDAESGQRSSTHAEAAGLLAGLVADGNRTITFCRSRRGTELVAADASRRLPKVADRIRPYRGGYLSAERREIEEALAMGEVDGVVTTTALELGVDLDGLDAVVVNGFPGTIASFWQQVGRAGRDGRTSLGVLVGGSDQLDQWLMANPTELFRRSPEPAVVNPANRFVSRPHLRCAAFELPLTHADREFWPGLIDETICELVRSDDLAVRRRSSGPIAVWTGNGWPAHGIGLRSSGGGTVSIVDTSGSAIGTVEWARAAEMVHEGAVYLHRGTSWQVTELDLEHRRAVVERHDGSDYTVVRSTTDLALVATEVTATLGGAHLELGEVEVTRQVTGYQRKKVGSGDVLESVRLDLPPSTLTTRAFWYAIDQSVLDAAGLDPTRVPGALHAAEHAAIGMLPLFTICDRWDVGGVSTAHLPETGTATIVIYDAYPGGAGVAELGYSAGTGLLLATLRSIEACRCADGCPSCVQSPKCGNGNEPLDKAGAASLIRNLVGVA